ncbi:MAG: WD40/YVTN/BNR-like repeat-containing protein, partial [Thermoflexibacteraceae bacterium]
MKKLFEPFRFSLYKGVGFALLVGQLIGCQSNNTVDSQEKTVEQLAQEEYNKKRIRRLNGYHKANSPDEYRLYDQLIRTGEGANAPTYQYGYLMKAYQEALNNAVFAAARTENTITWRERGPANVPARTRAILIDPENSQVWLAGSASGGIWRSTDRGRTWTNLTPNLPSPNEAFGSNMNN